MSQNPQISVIVPVFNAASYLGRCLDALNSSSYTSLEIMVVDDASTDDSADIARKKGVTVHQLPQQSGPAAARNYGATKAKGDIIFFIDSDILVQQWTIERVAKNFMENPGVAALFGSYDDNPSEKNFLSQYRNLLHHYVHQQSDSEAVTFWAGCGAIRRDVFEKVGGFDQKRYTRPEIEDIELGYRMRRMGYRILLDKKLQVKHLKQWRFISLLRADIFCRAIPWSKLILESRGMINDLNLRTSDRISTVMVGLSVGIIPFSVMEPQLLYIILILTAVVFIINYRLYVFFLNTKGAKFVTLAFPMHLLYYLYSGVAFALTWGRHRLFLKRKPS